MTWKDLREALNSQLRDDDKIRRVDVDLDPKQMTSTGPRFDGVTIGTLADGSKTATNHSVLLGSATTRNA